VAERFRLSKWYLDCLNEQGEALIVYWAELRRQGLALRYASSLHFTGGSLQERSSFRAGRPPRVAAERLEWSCRALETGGIWTRIGPAPAGRVLYRKGAGKVVWRCLQPLARVEARCAGRSIEGPGYAEHLTLTIAPWDLPFEVLRWGRAHFPGRSAVWIDWTGPEPASLVLIDGKEVEGARVVDNLVSAPHMALRLSGHRTLRKGPVAGTSVGSIPLVRRALSKAGLLIDEHKWLSSAALEEAGAGLRGSAIHEVVKWR